MPTTLAAAGVKTLAGPGSAVSKAVDQLPHLPTNLSDAERALSAAAGAGLMLLPTRGLAGLLAKFAGGTLLFRAATGHCAGYQMLGLSGTQGDRWGSDKAIGGPERPGQLAGVHPVGYTATTSVPAGAGVRVEEAVTVSRPPAEVYAFWRNYANLPKFQGQIESVTDLGEGRSHWVMKGPLGVRLEWDADLVNDEPGRLIAWRSVPGGDLGTAGAVHFDPAPGGGTAVKLNVKFDPPAGKLSVAAAKLIGMDPATQTRRDLARLKELLEGGR
jgi:uncharacterized membrane protein